MARRYSVYVVQLRSRCTRCKRRRKPGMRCCVYVGHTGKTPEERLEDHRDPPPGQRPTVVTECDGVLRRDLGLGATFRSPEEAQSAEASLAAYLKELNYTVFGGPRAR
jgi:hypothetical protein